MSDWHEHLPEDLEETAQRLRAERPSASALDLDRVKLSVRRKSTGGMPLVGGLRTKLLAPVLTFGIMGGGSTAVVLADGHDGNGNDGNGGNDNNASKSQYCPPQGSHGSVAAQHCTQKPPPKSSKSNKSNRGSHNSHAHGHNHGDN